MKEAAALLQLENRARLCTACDLCNNRSYGVPGEGPVDADIVIIGEAPGDLENKTGHPFYGRSGQLLNKMLANAGISRTDCYVTNMVKCWPGEGNPDPPQYAIDECSGWLDSQLNLIRPKGIITLGKFSTGKFINLKGLTQGAVQGAIREAWWSPNERCLIMPLYHPAYLLRNNAEQADTQEYLNKFKEKIYG